MPLTIVLAIVAQGNTNAITETESIILSILARRALCITESGKPGWVYDVAEVGDVVAILPGHNVPMILRPCGKGTHPVNENENYTGVSYQVVGEAYIHGIMYGEAVEGKREEDFKRIRLL